MVTRVTKQRASPKPAKKGATRSLEDDVQSALSWLKGHSDKCTLDGMARYVILSTNALGVSVANLHVLAKQLGRDHELALALWKTGGYEARMLTAFVDEPERVTSAQMDHWCRDFDSWAICDTLCFHLFNRTPHAWSKIAQWSAKRDEFVRRAAFALLASMGKEDEAAGNERFLEGLRLIERAATDERNFVKKGVSWALRSVGRRNLAINAAAVKLAERLSVSSDPTARWIGKDALKDLTKPKVIARLAADDRKRKPKRKG
jgi:3-methyladenine DNA glycosylase AlkD